MNDTDKQIKELLTTLKIQSSIKHVQHPTTLEEWPSNADKWLITLTTDAGYKETFDYYTGIGHRVYDRRAYVKANRPTCYRWYSADYTKYKYKRLTPNGFTNFMFWSKPVKPSITALLYSLSADSSALSVIFEYWCDEYGYNTDSIKDQATYRTCQDNTIKLKALGFDLDELQDLFQDY